MNKYIFLFASVIVGCLSANRVELYNQYRHVIDPVLAQAARQWAEHVGAPAGTVPHFSWAAINRVMFSHMFSLATNVATGPAAPSAQWNELADVCDFLSHEVLFRARAHAVRTLVEHHVNGEHLSVFHMRRLLAMVTQWREEVHANKMLRTFIRFYRAA